MGLLPLQRFLLACLVTAAEAAVFAEEASPSLKLVGIVDLQKAKCALLEVERQGPGGEKILTRQSLFEGDRFGELEVLGIEEQTGKVTVNLAGRVRTLQIEPAGASSASPLSVAGKQRESGSLSLRSASLVQVLAVYQDWSGLTVLWPSSLVQCSVDFRSQSPLAFPDGARALETALADKGILMQPVGEKLVAVATRDEWARLPALPVLQERHGELTAALGRNETIQAGSLKLVDASIPQFLEIYQELAGRTLLRSPRLPGIKLTVKSQTALTRPEAVHMGDVLMALNGISMVPQGEKFIFVVGRDDLSRLTGLLARHLPDPLSASTAMTPVVLSKGAGDALVAAGAIRLVDASLSQVMEVYQRLTRRVVEIGAGVPQVRLTLAAQTDLNRNELVYAFDMLLGLNQLALVALGNEHFKLVPAADLDKKTNTK